MSTDPGSDAPVELGHANDASRQSRVESSTKLEESLQELGKSRPITATFLTSLATSADDQGEISDQAFVEALLEALLKLEGAIAQQQQDVGDITVPLTLFGKTYHVSPNRLRRR